MKFKEYRSKDEVLDDTPDQRVPRDKYWGYHLIVDMSNCDERMDSPGYIKQFFAALIKELDMKAMSEIMIKRAIGQEGRGLSAVQIITTSSITFHGDDDKYCIYLDVFSCKPFERGKVMKTVEQFFKPEHVADIFIYRDAGKHGSLKK